MTALEKVFYGPQSMADCHKIPHHITPEVMWLHSGHLAASLQMTCNPVIIICYLLCQLSQKVSWKAGKERLQAEETKKNRNPLACRNRAEIFMCMEERGNLSAGCRNGAEILKTVNPKDCGNLTKTSFPAWKRTDNLWWSAGTFKTKRDGCWEDFSSMQSWNTSAGSSFAPFI